MLTSEEQKFIDYWEQKRTENKLNPFFFAKGFVVGLAIGLLIIVSIGVGWYKRANMEANVALSPIVLIIAIIFTALFLAIFYNSFKYEQNEQLYIELLNKEKHHK